MAAEFDYDREGATPIEQWSITDSAIPNDSVVEVFTEHI